MTISAFKKQFFKVLSQEYPAGELQSIFDICTKFYLGISRLEVALDPERKLNSGEQQALSIALNRLRMQEPVQYITGKTTFFGLEFSVNEHVLIPRPETEELVEWILEEVSEVKKNLRILDIGTGSGCIGISLASMLPGAEVWMLDFSEEALKVARKNAEDIGVRARFVHQDVLKIARLEKQYDLIVSNPPYVRELEMAEMRPNVLQYEPAAALYVRDEDPLIFYRKIADLADIGLKTSGMLFFEINQYLGAQTSELLEERNFRTCLRKDIFGVDRMLKAEKR